MLVPADVELLFASIRRLWGMAVVFISHKLHEVVDLADRIGILRRGSWWPTCRPRGWTRRRSRP